MKTLPPHPAFILHSTRCRPYSSSGSNNMASDWTARYLHYWREAATVPTSAGTPNKPLLTRTRMYGFTCTPHSFQAQAKGLVAPIINDAGGSLKNKLFSSSLFICILISTSCSSCPASADFTSSLFYFSAYFFSFPFVLPLTHLLFHFSCFDYFIFFSSTCNAFSWSKPVLIESLQSDIQICNVVMWQQMTPHPSSVHCVRRDSRRTIIVCDEQEYRHVITEWRTSEVQMGNNDPKWNVLKNKTNENNLTVSQSEGSSQCNAFRHLRHLECHVSGNWVASETTWTAM